MSFLDGRCKVCFREIRGYDTSAKGRIVWVHWSQKWFGHVAEPDELTLRKLYGDR